MAVWAIQEFGIGCIIAPSFGDIFYGNCLQNGILPIRLDRARVDLLAGAAAAGQTMTVDLRAGTVSTASSGTIAFEIPAAQREALLSGLDEVDQTLGMSAAIDLFQQHDRQMRPWVYA
jgi:3-isopropylmalate/(R)-2-methylmalate dehydratase small subunit